MLGGLTRGLRHHAAMHLAVAAGVAVATAVLTGALAVGDSLRAGLERLTEERLGAVDLALVAPATVTEGLASRLEDDPGFGAHWHRAVPLLIVPGSARHATGGGLAGGVTVLGVDADFLAAFPPGPGRFDAGLLERRPGQAAPPVVLNAALARELDAAAGDRVVLHFEAGGAVPRASLLGERDSEDRIEGLLLEVVAVIPDRGPGRFSLAPLQTAPNNAFVALDRLRWRLPRRLGGSGLPQHRVNALLAVRDRPGATSDPAAAGAPAALGRALTLDDLGLRLVPGGAAGVPWVAVESRELVLRPALAEAALDAARALGAPAAPVLSYLANSMRVGAREVPYSAVAALPLPPPGGTGTLTLAGGGPAPVLADDEVLLDAWTADDLGASPGDELEMEYFVVGAGDALETARHRFRVAGVAAMSGLAVDSGLTPDVPGIADADDMAAWDPPFPVDLGRVRPRDEEYWDRWRAAPKAFVAPATGRALWASRYGDLTSVRVAVPAGADAPSVDELAADELAARLERGILDRVDPAAVGLAFQPVRSRGLEGAAGSADFAGLFLGFSIFLIAAAALLVGLLFALGVELRAAELGLLLAVGYPLAAVRRRLLAESAAVAAVGGLVGLALAAGYAELLLGQLGRWWAPLLGDGDTAGPLLALTIEPRSLAIGFAGALVLVLAVVWLTVRRLARVPARALLAGTVETEPAASAEAGAKRRPGRLARWLLAGSLLAAVALGAAAALVEEAGSSPALFFGLGTALLTAGCSAFAIWTRRPGAGLERADGAVVPRIAARNSARHRGRSLLAATLVACSAFVLVAVAANRRPSEPATGRTSGTGGYALVAESSAPLYEDLGDPEGRRDLGFGDDESDRLAAARFFRFRLRPGDDASCLNLYRPSEPRLLGVPESFLDRGGFSFAGAIEERDDPWELLALDLGEDVVPAIGDAESVRWILHLGLGDELTVTDERGRPLALRIVALLEHSLFQSELLIPEAAFRRHFPSRDGYRFFLVEAPGGATEGTAEELAAVLEPKLARFGFDAETAAARLAGYDAVQAIYLTTFQALGGLGLLLGTLGLGVVLARNVLERRTELAALRAFGWRRSTLAWMVVAENAFLLAVGLAVGTVAGLAAVAPHLAAGGHGLPWASLAATLGAVAAAGMLASAAAVAGALRVPLLPALKADAR